MRSSKIAFERPSATVQLGLACAALVACIWAAFVARWSQGQLVTAFGPPTWGLADDMYVSASFARSLMEGEGLRWYAGAPKIEGFSNPLWVIAMAAIHLLPDFSPEKLGLYVLVLDGAIVAATAVVVYRGLAQLEEAAGKRPSAVRWLLAIGLGLGAIPMCYWVSQGYEVGLVALLSTWAFVEALQPVERLRAGRIGLLVGLSFWTRMDGVVCCASAVVAVVLRVRDKRQLARFAGVVLGAIAALFLLRRAYYGDWLPNTYYLKMSGWPLARRLYFGWLQNSKTVTLLAVLIPPLIGVGLFVLDSAHRPALLAFVGPAATLAYSTHSGGDFAWLASGFDRHGAAATPLLVFGLSAILLGAKLRPWQIPFNTAWTYAVGILPLFSAYGPTPDGKFGHYLSVAQFRRLFRWRKPVQQDLLLALAINTGRLMQEFTEPGARLVLCDAGAKVYFSRRGGVDVLGKIEPYVAHLEARETEPPERRCWRNIAPSGHNKEDFPGLFALRKPEVTDMLPPRASAADYVSFVYKNRKFYGRRGSPLIRWSLVELIPAPELTQGRP